MLIDHRGGVADMLAEPGTFKDPAKLTTMAAWYATVRELPLRFEPGSSQEYSNGGFELLGMVVQSVSGEDYHDDTVGDLVRVARALRADRLLDAARTRATFGEPPHLGIASGAPRHPGVGGPAAR